MHDGWSLYYFIGDPNAFCFEQEFNLDFWFWIAKIMNTYLSHNQIDNIYQKIH